MSAEDKRKASRTYPLELKREAVAMLADGHSATSIAERLGLPRTNLIYKWRDQLKSREEVESARPKATVEELQAELSRVERERDILKKALAILGRNDS